MVRSGLIAAFAAYAHVAQAGCPYMDGDAVVRRDDNAASTDDFMGRYEVDDSDVYMTNPVGGPIEEQESLSAGERGPTLLEDQAFRRKVSSWKTQY